MNTKIMQEESQKAENSLHCGDEGFKYLTFWIDNQLYGIYVSDVIQIVSYQKITQVPDYPDYAKGIISIRGIVVPIIDIRTRFNKLPMPNVDKSCIIITSMNGIFVGFLVDSLNEVTEITGNYVSKPPQISNNYTYTYLNSIVKAQR